MEQAIKTGAEQCHSQREKQGMAKATMPEFRTVGNAEPKGEYIEIGKNRDKNPKHQQASGNPVTPQTQRKRQRYGWMREDGRHDQPVSG